jgi:hypothetical protein
MPKGEDGFVESPNVGIRAPCSNKRARPSPVAAGVGNNVDLEKTIVRRALLLQRTTGFMGKQRWQQDSGTAVAREAAKIAVESDRYSVHQNTDDVQR